MNKTPLVSVVTPMYNAEKYILETIQSVIDQGYSHWEMLIVDNKSTDSSRTIVRNVDDKRVKLIELDYNSGGPARPRNIGLDHASGEYVAFLDADDAWLNCKLDKQVGILIEGDFDIVHTLAYTINEESHRMGQLKNQNLYNKLSFFCDGLTACLFSNYININSVLMRKDDALRFNEDEYLIAVEDWLFWIENMHAKKKTFLIKESLILYRIVSDSASDRKSDTSYRKIFHLYSLLLNKQIMSLKFYCLCSCVNLVKLLIRKVLNAKMLKL